MSATHDSSFNFATDTTGSGNKSSDAKSISAGQHIIVLVWNYDEVPASGTVTYNKNGGGAVSAGAPVQVRSRSGNSDRGAAFIIRNPGAGSYVINTIGLDYVGLSAHVFNAKVNFWVQVSAGADGEGTGTTFTSGSVTPRFESSVAYGYWTHNVDGGGTSAMTVPGGWTLATGPNTNPHKQEDYDGASQPGGAAYRNLSGTSSVSFAPTCANSVAYLSLLVVISEPDPVYALMGGTDGRGWFGNDAFGGADSTVSTTFDPPIPAGQAIIVCLSLYDYTPVDASLLTIAGSGNALVLDDQITDGASNDGSVNFFSCEELDSDCSSIGYDATGLPAGDAGRYGQMMFFIVEEPDTINGFKTVTGVTRAQTSTTTVDPTNGGAVPFTPDTDDCLVIFGWTNRGHTEDLLPLSITPADFPTELQHTELHVTTSSPTEFGSVHNSITQSGSFMATRRQLVAAYSPVVTFTGPSPTSGATRSVLTAYNILGGTAGGDTTLSAGAVGITATAPSATLAPGAATLSAGVNSLAVTAPAATVVPGTVTLAAGTNGVVVVAPVASVQGVDQSLAAGANGILVTAPTATLLAIAPDNAPPFIVRRSDGFTPGSVRRSL